MLVTDILVVDLDQLIQGNRVLPYCAQYGRHTGLVGRALGQNRSNKKNAD